MVNGAALEKQVLERLYMLVPNASKILVAVSGGADSVALLRLLERGGVELEVAHFDHALRDDSGGGRRVREAVGGKAQAALSL